MRAYVITLIEHEQRRACRNKNERRKMRDVIGEYSPRSRELVLWLPEIFAARRLWAAGGLGFLGDFAIAVYANQFLTLLKIRHFYRNIIYL